MRVDGIEIEVDDSQDRKTPYMPMPAVLRREQRIDALRRAFFQHGNIEATIDALESL